MICLIIGSAKIAYRREVARLVSWCDNNNLHIEKMKEAIVDVRKKMRPQNPQTIRELEVERMSS